MRTPSVPGEWADRESAIMLAEQRFIAYYEPTVLAQFQCSTNQFDLIHTNYGGELTLASHYYDSLSEEEREALWLRIRFGYRLTADGKSMVAAFLPDLNAAPAPYQNKWAAFHLDGKHMKPLADDDRFVQWALRVLLGSWNIEDDVLVRIRHLVRDLAAFTTEWLGAPLLRELANPRLSLPLHNNLHAYEDSHHELYRWLIDGFDVKVARDLLIRLGGQVSGKRKGRWELLRPIGNIDAICNEMKHTSDLRGKAGHRVRPPNREFGAVDNFRLDLERVRDALWGFLLELEARLGCEASAALERQDAFAGLPQCSGPACEASRIPLQRMASAIGRTVERVELLQREHHEACHNGEVMVIHFSDGAILVVEVHTNAMNVCSMEDPVPSDFNTNLFAHFVPPRLLEND